MNKQKRYIHITGYYLAIQINELLIYAMTGMNLGNIVLSERSRHKMPHTAQFHLYEMSRTGKSLETESMSVVSQMGREGIGND